MTADTHIIRTLSCGMPVLIERVPSVSSVAMRWLLPIGAATDGAHEDGFASMLCEYLFRGSGDLDSRSHSDALDRLGVQRHASVGTHHMHLSATMVGSRVAEALPLLVDVVRRPRFEPDDLEPIRSLCLQTLQGLDDDPRHLVMLKVRENHLAAPFNRAGYGEADVLSSATHEAIVQSYARRTDPSKSILSLAGDVDPERTIDQLESLLSGWSGTTTEPAATDEPRRGSHHVMQDSAQVHIGMSYDAPSAVDQDTMLERLGVHVLGQSSSGRLFTEVRQKRSLCYSVGASYRAGRDTGRISFYAGTTPERAQETLDVSLREIHRMQEGVSADEFHRAVIGMKSSLVMAGESTTARSAALSGDWFRLGRTRTLADIAAEVDAITHDDLNAYLARRVPEAFTIVALGPAPLAVPEAVA
ncbi:MAG: pitrilysin family protein [Planctomycetota bacterium]